MIRYLFVDFPVDIMLTKSGTLLLCMHMCMVAAEQFSFLQGVEEHGYYAKRESARWTCEIGM